MIELWIVKNECMVLKLVETYPYIGCRIISWWLDLGVAENEKSVIVLEIQEVNTVFDGYKLEKNKLKTNKKMLF